LLIANCDEFIFYDDLVREAEKQRRSTRKPVAAKAARGAKPGPAEDDEERKSAGLDLVMETAAALFEERGEEEKVWGSMVKQALKRRHPGFNETFHGFRTFSALLEEAQARGLLTLEYDEKSGGYIIRTIQHE
jgi:hypothetical protein